jgi:hypothetical protein
MAATATIPATVTVPGQLVYDAIVRLTAAKHGMMALSDSTDTPLGDDDRGWREHQSPLDLHGAQLGDDHA